MEPDELQSKRWQVGSIAILLLILSAVISQVNPEKKLIYSALLRVGILLGALWLAIPVIIRHPKILKRLPWYIIGAGVLFAVFAKQLWMLIPLFILLAILSMFAGTRPGNRR